MSTVSATLTVKVSPGASRERVGPWMADGALKIAVTAPPESGKANAAVCKLLADKLGLSTSAIVLLRGHSASRKVISIAGLDLAVVQQRLS